MTKLALSTDWTTGTSREQPDSIVGFFGRIDVEDLEWEPLPPYLVEKAKLAEQFAAQCRREDEETERFLARARDALRTENEAEAQAIKEEARGLAYEITRFERVHFARLRGGKGFRKR